MNSVWFGNQIRNNRIVLVDTTWHRKFFSRQLYLHSHLPLPSCFFPRFSLLYEIKNTLRGHRFRCRVAKRLTWVYCFGICLRNSLYCHVNDWTTPQWSIENRWTQDMCTRSSMQIPSIRAKLIHSRKLVKLLFPFVSTAFSTFCECSFLHACFTDC